MVNFIISKVPLKHSSNLPGFLMTVLFASCFLFTFFFFYFVFFLFLWLCRGYKLLSNLLRNQLGDRSRLPVCMLKTKGFYYYNLTTRFFMRIPQIMRIDIYCDIHIKKFLICKVIQMCNLTDKCMYTHTYTLLSFLVNKNRTIITVQSYCPRYIVKLLKCNCHINQHENY